MGQCNSDPTDPISSEPFGIFGGTFDPVHYGHLRAAIEVREQLGLPEIRLLPAARPPHRAPPLASAEHRLAMLQGAVADRPGLQADDTELRRDGPSWMVDTLAGFRAASGDTPLVLIIGQDAANGLDRWHEWSRLFELAHIAVMRRPDARPEYCPVLARQMRERGTNDAGDLRLQTAGRVIPVNVTQLDISSSTIRGLINAGRSADCLAPPAVLDYIRVHGLYRDRIRASQPR